MYRWSPLILVLLVFFFIFYPSLKDDNIILFFYLNPLLTKLYRYGLLSLVEVENRKKFSVFCLKYFLFRLQKPTPRSSISHRNGHHFSITCGTVSWEVFHVSFRYRRYRIALQEEASWDSYCRLRWLFGSVSDPSIFFTLIPALKYLPVLISKVLNDTVTVPGISSGTG